jgi:hypothetical protein
MFSADFGRKNTSFEALQLFIVLSESFYLSPAFFVVSQSRRNKISPLETAMPPKRTNPDTMPATAVH